MNEKELQVMAKEIRSRVRNNDYHFTPEVKKTVEKVTKSMHVIMGDCHQWHSDEFVLTLIEAYKKLHLASPNYEAFGIALEHVMSQLVNDTLEAKGE